jgi:hypothetical protein
MGGNQRGARFYPVGPASYPGIQNTVPVVSTRQRWILRSHLAGTMNAPPRKSHHGTGL